MRLDELPARVINFEDKPRPRKKMKSTPAQIRAQAGYYQRNREKLKARALNRWRKLNGKI